MKVVVMGGGGFLGSYLVETLLANGQDVRVFDRPDARYLEYSSQRGANIVTGNFLDPNAVGNAILNRDIVYHLVSATVPQTSNENPRYDVEANLIGTLQLLEQMRSANAFLQASLYPGESKVFNIGSRHGHSLNDIIGAIENIVQVPLRIKHLPGRLFDVPVNILDITRARSRLGWEPKVLLEEGILHAFEWMQREQKNNLCCLHFE